MFYFKLVQSVLIFFTFFFGISQNAVLSTGSDFKNEFGSFSYSVGQILISPDDTEQRRRALNVRRTFDNLFKYVKNSLKYRQNGE